MRCPLCATTQRLCVSCAGSAGCLLSCCLLPAARALQWGGQLQSGSVCPARAWGWLLSPTLPPPAPPTPSPDKPSYVSWLSTIKPRFSNPRAQSHTSSPIVWLNESDVSVLAPSCADLGHFSVAPPVFPCSPSRPPSHPSPLPPCPVPGWLRRHSGLAEGQLHGWQQRVPPPPCAPRL